MSADKDLVLEPEDECNEHICADLAQLLGYRLRGCEAANDELIMWSLYDENRHIVDAFLTFYPVTNTVQITNSAGNILSNHKLNITLSQ